MSAVQFAERWNEDVARQWLAEFEVSGMTLSAFAQQLGVSTQRFGYWRERLGWPARPSGPRFVELAVRPRPISAPALEIRFPAGHVLSIPAGVASLADVLDLVEGLGC